MVGRRFDDGTFTLDLCIPGQAGEAWEVVGTFVVCAVRVVHWPARSRPTCSSDPRRSRVRVLRGDRSGPLATDDR